MLNGQNMLGMAKVICRQSLKSFLILRKKILGSLNKGKPENPFNIARNQEFELITSHLFKNLISTKPAWYSQWSLIPSRNLK